MRVTGGTWTRILRSTDACSTLELRPQYPQRDLNSRYWLERPVSWTGLDDGGEFRSRWGRRTRTSVIGFKGRCPSRWRIPQCAGRAGLFARLAFSIEARAAAVDLRSPAWVVAHVAVQYRSRPGATLAPKPVRCWLSPGPHGTRTRIAVLRGGQA